ncbi:hypothetical protein ACJW30_09G086700 [Castanea mollissima]
MTRKTKIEKFEDLINKIDTLIPINREILNQNHVLWLMLKNKNTIGSTVLTATKLYMLKGGKNFITLSFSIETYRVNKTIFYFLSFFNSNTQYYVIQLCKSNSTTIKSKNLNPNL